VPDWREYKLIDISGAILYAIYDNVWDKALVADFQRMLSSLSGLTPGLWNIDGLNDALSLPLSRRMQIDAQMRAEILGTEGAAPGSRLIDVLGIRFVALHDPVPTPGFRPLWHDPERNWIMENTAALPRFQVYDSHVAVDTPDEAQAVMRAWRERTLVIEDPLHTLAKTTGSVDEMASAPGAAPAELDVRKDEDTDYLVDVSATRPCWLFLADANYPGWFATIDGQPAPLFTAQVLGKAVAIPAGRHRVRIAFRSATFAWGASISAVSLLATVCLVVLRPRRRRIKVEAG
jgi:hypothetical protein